MLISRVRENENLNLSLEKLNSIQIERIVFEMMIEIDKY